jgi:hypothetical protein
MATFPSIDAAHSRAVAKTQDGTWVEAFAARGKDGAIGVWALRPMFNVSGFAANGQNKQGSWDFLTDDAAV